MSGRGGRGGRPFKPRRFRCDECSDGFGQRQGLWRHIKENHGPIMYLYCRRCHYKATRRETINRHYARFHPSHLCESRQICEERERPEQTPPAARMLVTSEGPAKSTPPTSTPPATIMDVETAPLVVEEDTLSLYPTRISPLRPSSPSPPTFTAAPDASPDRVATKGKPRGMLFMDRPPGSPQTSEASSLPASEVVPPVDPRFADKGTQTSPERRMVKGFIREQRVRTTFAEGRQVRREATADLTETWVEL